MIPFHHHLGQGIDEKITVTSGPSHLSIFMVLEDPSTSFNPEAGSTLAFDTMA